MKLNFGYSYRSLRYSPRVVPLSYSRLDRVIWSFRSRFPNLLGGVRLVIENPSGNPRCKPGVPTGKVRCAEEQAAVMLSSKQEWDTLRVLWLK